VYAYTFEPDANPVVAITVKSPPDGSFVAIVPENTPAGLIDSPDGNPVCENPTTFRPLKVVTETENGVIGTFSIKSKFDDGISVNVKASSTISKLTVFVAVAGDPETVATTSNAVGGVIWVGIPTINPFESNESPVPTRASADNMTSLPDVAVATNRMFDG
jgi:hypothetical protein